MKLSREITNIIRFILDNLVPPIVRDSKLFMWLPFKLLFKDKSNLFFSFKEKINNLNTSQIAEIYKKTFDVHIDRQTDLNSESIRKILNELEGDSVLDVGCGSGYLIRLIENDFKVTGLDFCKSPDYHIINNGTSFIEADATTLPFKDNSFDTVICAHTLEHIVDIYKAIKELKRVCKKKLIIIVPKQKPYKYTFDLHLHFFPYEYSLLILMNNIKVKPSINSIETIKGDLFYKEEFNDVTKAKFK